MEKVKSLVDKLNHQVNSQANAATLLATVKMLEATLGAQLTDSPEKGEGPIVVDVPRFFVIEKGTGEPVSAATSENEAATVTIHPFSYTERVNEPKEKEENVEAHSQPESTKTDEVVNETKEQSLKNPAPEKPGVDDAPINYEVSETDEITVAENTILNVSEAGDEKVVSEDTAIDHEVSKNEEIPVTENLTVSEEAEEPAQKIVEDLIIDEAEIEAELEQIKEKAEAINKISSHVNPVLSLDFDNEIPTFAHQPHFNEKETEKSTELNEIAGRQNPGYSVNDKLKAENVELSEQLVDNTPIKDLRKAISVNDKFTFLHDLFRNDEVMYNRSLKTINNFSIYPEAEFWIRRELKVKLGWDEKTEAVKIFDQYVRRRFS